MTTTKDSAEDFTAASNDGRFFASVLDALGEQISVIDSQGGIKWVNRSWKEFAVDNGGHPGEVWGKRNYLGVCALSADGGDGDATDALQGIQRVITGDQADFSFEYTCDSPTEQRWFLMRVRPLESTRWNYFVVSHLDITKMKQAELLVEELAIQDGLTGIANRRRFDEFLSSEWLRAQRLGKPVSMVLLDIDFFKPYNDNYGHLAGDECLRRIGNALKHFARRPSDLVARYGGEEFAVILGGTELDDAREIAERIRSSIQALQIPHAFALPVGTITVSAGVASLQPDMQSDASGSDLIDAADKALYEAKDNGRNRVHTAPLG